MLTTKRNDAEDYDVLLDGEKVGWLRKMHNGGKGKIWMARVDHPSGVIERVDQKRRNALTAVERLLKSRLG